MQKTAGRFCAPRHSFAVFLFGFLLRVFASLVGDAAAGLARGLAGSLAFAAAAVLRALAKVAGFNGSNMLHMIFLLGMVFTKNSIAKT